VVARKGNMICRVKVFSSNLESEGRQREKIVDDWSNVSTTFDCKRATLALLACMDRKSGFWIAYRWTEVILHINDNQCWDESHTDKP
jgi:hypothetical protein